MKKMTHKEKDVQIKELEDLVNRADDDMELINGELDDMKRRYNRLLLSQPPIGLSGPEFELLHLINRYSRSGARPEFYADTMKMDIELVEMYGEKLFKIGYVSKLIGANGKFTYIPIDL